MQADHTKYIYPSIRYKRIDEKRKIMIAIVYDFLKRNNILREYVEAFMKFHSEDIPKDNRKLIIKCIEYGVDKVLSSKGFYRFRNFFYEKNISFDYFSHDKMANFWITVDGIWISVVDKNKSLKI